MLTLEIDEVEDLIPAPTTTLAQDGHGHIMTNEAYHALPDIGSTSLGYLEESSLHLVNRDLFRMESASLDIGTAVHVLTLEPEKFEDEFAIGPINAPRNTTIGKEKWRAFEEQLDGRIVLTAEEHIKAERMALNLRTIMKAYLQTGVAERSFFSTERGIPMKCRPDLLFQTPNGWIIFDVKTTKDIDKLEYVTEDYNYVRSQAWYRRVMTANGYNIIGNVLAFVENSGKYMVKLRALSSTDLARADEEIETLLIKHEDYLKTGQVTEMIKPIEIFKWKKREEADNA